MFDEVLSGKPTANQNNGKQPIKNGGFPFDEHLVSQPNGKAAEYNNNGYGDPKHGFDLLAADQHPADL